MNHRQIEAFRAVINLGTMTAAAEVLRTSQPAVSRMISEFEAATGLALFDRRHGRVMPTQEGMRLYDVVERSFQGIDSVMQFAADMRDFRDAHITVAAMPSLCFDLIPRAVSRFTRIHKGARVTIHARSSRQVVSWMLSQSADFGIATPPFDVRDVRADLSVSVPCVCVMQAGHPLADREEILPTDLKDEQLIVLTNSLMLHDFQSIFSKVGVRFNPPIETTLSAVAMRMAELGDGIALVEPYSLTASSPDRIAIRPFRPQVEFDFSLLLSASRKPSMATLAFRDILVAELHDTLLPSFATPKIYQ